MGLKERLPENAIAVTMVGLAKKFIVLLFPSFLEGHDQRGTLTKSGAINQPRSEVSIEARKDRYRVLDKPGKLKDEMRPYHFLHFFCLHAST